MAPGSSGCASASSPRGDNAGRAARAAGYDTTCVGFTGNAASRGFNRYFDYKAWGNLDEAPLRKAEGLNDVTQPELDRLIDAGEPWFVLLRHMDPHAPYLPPSPYDRLFYWGDECDPTKNSMAPVMSFAPFRDFFASWMPPGITDADFVMASDDGAIAYMDACIGRLLHQLEARGVAEQTIVVLTADHGETLYDHDCFFDHHGIYDCVLHVPCVIRYPGRVPAGRRVTGTCQHADLLPTLLELAGMPEAIPEDVTGTSLLDLVAGLALHPRPRALHHRGNLDAQARLAHSGVETDHGPGARFSFQAGGRAL